MTPRAKRSGGELFIVDNSDDRWKVQHYLHDWCEISHAFDIATAYFEIGALLALDGQWQKLDRICILMGDEVSRRTRQAFEAGLAAITQRLDRSIKAAQEQAPQPTPGRQPCDRVAPGRGAGSPCHVTGVAPPARYPGVEKR